MKQKSASLTSANTPDVVENVEKQIADAEKRYQDLLDRIKVGTRKWASSNGMDLSPFTRVAVPVRRPDGSLCPEFFQVHYKGTIVVLF